MDRGHAGLGYACLVRVGLASVMKLRALASWFSTPVAKWGVLAFLAGAIGSAIAAPNPVSGPKPSDGGYQTSAAHAILIEADSGSVLFEKGADDLIPPASLSKLMTAEVVFNEIKQGRLNPPMNSSSAPMLGAGAALLRARRACSFRSTARSPWMISCMA